MSAQDSSPSNGSPWLVIRHVAQEHIGTLAPVLRAAGMEYRYVDVFRGDSIPKDAGGLQGLIIMGGPMGVYEAERYPFLQEEQNLIQEAINADTPVLGICLGSQLVAAALGAAVYPGSGKELGWHTVQVVDPIDAVVGSLPPSFIAFHWHGDTFDLPRGAVRLLRSSLYENQAFRWGKNVYAFQFHFEVTAEMVAEWLGDPGCCADLAGTAGVSAALIRQQSTQWAEPLEKLSEQVFRRFFERSTVIRPAHPPA